MSEKYLGRGEGGFHICSLVKLLNFPVTKIGLASVRCSLLNLYKFNFLNFVFDETKYI